MPKLPSFEPVTNAEMRLFWRIIPSQSDVKRLLLEIEHARRVLDELERMREVIDAAWKLEIGGQLVALYHMKVTLSEERFRTAR